MIFLEPWLAYFMSEPLLQLSPVSTTLRRKMMIRVGVRILFDLRQ
jgi:hypothetical protein